MTAENPKGTKTPEWVGEGDARRDVSSLPDRGVSIMALDVVLRVSNALKTHSNEFVALQATLLRTISDHEKRITDLERAQEMGPYREETPSYHDWNELLAKAGTQLSRRVKDPRDSLNSERAREIAQEVVKGTKTADDAQAFQLLKSRGWKIAIEALKWIAVATASIVAAKYGFHIGQ
jgi:hypothetical protein